MSNRDDVEIPKWAVNATAFVIRAIPVTILLYITAWNPWVVVLLIASEICDAVADGFRDAAAHERSRQRLLKGYHGPAPVLSSPDKPESKGPPLRRRRGGLTDEEAARWDRAVESGEAVARLQQLVDPTGPRHGHRGVPSDGDESLPT